MCQFSHGEHQCASRCWCSPTRHTNSTSLYLTLHGPTMILIHTTRLYMALIDSVWLYRSLPWLQHSTSTYYGSTSFYFTLTYSTLPYIGVLHSTLLYCHLLLLYFTLLDCYFTIALYMTLHYSTMAVPHST